MGNSESHPVRDPPPPSLTRRGQSQFPDSPVEVLTWLWAAVWGREAGQMSRSPGEEAAPRGGRAGPLARETASSPADLAVGLELGHSPWAGLTRFQD